MLGAAALLLVLACVNVTNLMLARGSVRAREIAVRVALGAGRGRIVRQLLTEALVLATAGTIVGLLLAYIGVRLLLAFGAAALPRLDRVPFDARVLGFALAAMLITALLVGLAPALRLAGTSLKALMNEGGRSSTAGSDRAPHAENDDGGGDRPRDHAGRRRGMAGAQLRQSRERRVRVRAAGSAGIRGAPPARTHPAAAGHAQSLPPSSPIA